MAIEVTVQDASEGTDVTVQDGSAALDVTVTGGADTRTNVSDSGVEVVPETSDINFDTNLSVTDDGDGSVTVDASGGGGSGIWTEDGNSPQTTTGVTSDTYTLSGTYDLVVVHFIIEDVSSSNNQIDLRYNGDTGTNYTYTKLGGANNAGTSQVDNLFVIRANDSVTNTFLMEGNSNSPELSGGQDPIRAGGGVAVGWQNTAVTPPLDSMTILGAGTFDIRWQVFGRDIGSGGIP